jgi:hypothetical protein
MTTYQLAKGKNAAKGLWKPYIADGEEHPHALLCCIQCGKLFPICPAETDLMANGQTWKEIACPFCKWKDQITLVGWDDDGTESMGIERN